MQDLEAPEAEYICPICKTPTRGLPELVFTESQVLWKGKVINFTARQEQKMFRFLYERRGRLVAHADLQDEFAQNSGNPHQLIRVYVRHIRDRLVSNMLPVQLHSIWGEGYILNVVEFRND